jgi:amino acid permease
MHQPVSKEHNYSAYGAINSYDNNTDEECHALSTASTNRDKLTIIANALNALLGVALFAMPWGFQQSGIVGGSIVIFVVAGLSFETARILLVSQKVYFQRTGEIKGYPEIASAALGPTWHTVVQVTTIISCLGGCTGYIIFFGQTLGQAFSLPAKTVIHIMTIPLILLSWIRSFHDLTVVTVFGVVALLSSVVILLLDGSSSITDVQSTPLVLTDTVINFVGSATFLFTIHYCVLSIGAESLRSKPWLVLSSSEDSNSPSPSPSRSSSAFVALEKSIALSYISASVIIWIVGCSGYIMYRNSDLVRDATGAVVGGCEQPVCQNVILNISPGILR